MSRPTFHPWLPHESPRGFAATTWNSVGGWLARQLANGCEKAHRTRLGSLAERLRSERLIAADGSIPSVDPATPARILEDPAPTPLRDVIGPYDLRRLRSACEALFAAGARATFAEDKRLTANVTHSACEAPTKPLGHSSRRCLHEYAPMTPYRVLTVQFCSEGLQHAFPKHWTVMRNRVLHRGGDQAILLAMATWASGANGKRAKKVQRTVQQV